MSASAASRATFQSRRTSRSAGIGGLPLEAFYLRLFRMIAMASLTCLPPSREGVPVSVRHGHHALQEGYGLVFGLVFLVRQGFLLAFCGNVRLLDTPPSAVGMPAVAVRAAGVCGLWPAAALVSVIAAGAVRWPGHAPSWLR